MSAVEQSPSLEQALRRWELAMTEGGAPVVQHLAPGLPPELVRVTLVGLGVGSHPDVVTWWPGTTAPRG